MRHCFISIRFLYAFQTSQLFFLVIEHRHFILPKVIHYHTHHVFTISVASRSGSPEVS